jgi:hypothetical protein
MMWSQYRMIIYSVLLILMMLLRPQGLFGSHEIGDVYRWLKDRLIKPKIPEASR